jgi:hypothetical protein
VSNAQELILHILSFLPRKETLDYSSPYFQSPKKFFPKYATISRNWQYAVERITFSSIGLKSTELGDFSRMFAPAHRNAVLRSLRYEIVLPTYDDLACAVFESAEDQDANDDAFSEAVHGLFAVLKSWPENMPQTQHRSQPAPLALYISKVYSPYDRMHRNWDLNVIQWMEYQSGKRDDLFDERYQHSVIRLKRWEQLQTLPRVIEFRVRGRWRRILGPQSIARIASKFPSLEKIRWKLNDDENNDADTRQQLRSGQYMIPPVITSY